VTRVAGELTQDVRYTSVQIGVSPPDSLIAVPSGIEQAPPPVQIAPVQSLAPDVWAVRGGGYWSLVVAFNDHVLVVEAPGGGSAETIAQVKTLVPGKPIRYIAPTHHHDDHAGGMRDFVAEGATIVTTAGNKAYFERMARSRPTIRLDALARNPREARVEVITGKRRVLTDGRHTVELHDIGPSPHAQEMLVAWLPNEGILFQGDLLNLPGNSIIPTNSANATTAHFAQWLKGRGWDVKVLAGVHMPPGKVSELDEAIAKSDVRP
jgi:glyoxylase-like metal-dependent hydrolase (beta-lactamase superfamily II)